MSELPAELTSLIMEVIAARVEGEHEMATTIFSRICALGDRALFAACLGWAEVIVQLTDMRDPDPGVFAYPEVDRVDGEEPSLDDLNYRHMLWIGRFLAAAANQDMDTAVALFGADPDGSELGHHAAALVDLAAQLVRDRVTQTPNEGVDVP